MQSVDLDVYYEIVCINIRITHWSGRVCLSSALGCLFMNGWASQEDCIASRGVVSCTFAKGILSYPLFLELAVLFTVGSSAIDLILWLNYLIELSFSSWRHACWVSWNVLSSRRISFFQHELPSPLLLWWVSTTGEIVNYPNVATNLKSWFALRTCWSIRPFGICSCFIVVEQYYHAQTWRSEGSLPYHFQFTVFIRFSRFSLMIVYIQFYRKRLVLQ